jgi:hypothetical protein
MDRGLSKLLPDAMAWMEAFCSYSIDFNLLSFICMASKSLHSLFESIILTESLTIMLFDMFVIALTK